MTTETLLKALDKIDDKMQDFKLEQTILSDRLLQVEQKGGTRYDGPSGGGESLGAQVVKAFQANADTLAKSKSLRLEIKAAGDTITTTSGRTNIGGGVGAPGSSILLGVQNGLMQRNASGTSVSEYFRYTGTQGAAQVQATEGGAKAAVRPDHTMITQSAITIAGYSKMSRQALSDSAELKSAIDITLRRAVNTALDTVLCAGNVTPAWDGLLTLATAYTSVVYSPLVDAISEAVAVMQTAGFVPDAVALSPADWLQITIARGSDGHPLSGAYLGILPEAMRGLRVVLSPGVTVGKALVMDSGQIELLVSDDFAIEFGYVNDDFTKNLVSILGEMRTIPIFRSVGAARLITPMA
jgi:Phage capsid family